MLIKILTLFLCLTFFSVQANQTYLANVKVQTLNVKSAPNEKGFAFTVPQDTTVVINLIVGPWARIIYFPDWKNTDINKEGWVYLDTLEIIDEGETTTNRKTIDGNHCQKYFHSDDVSCVTFKKPKLECENVLLQDKFDWCEVKLDYSVETNYAGKDKPIVQVGCTVELEINNGRMATFDSREFKRKETYEHVLINEGFENKYENGSYKHKFQFDTFQNVETVKVIKAFCNVEHSFLM